MLSAMAMAMAMAMALANCKATDASWNRARARHLVGPFCFDYSD